MERTAQLVSRMAMALGDQGGRRKEILPALSVILGEMPPEIIQAAAFQPAVHLVVHTLLGQVGSDYECLALLGRLLDRLSPEQAQSVLPGVASKLARAFKTTLPDQHARLLSHTLQLALSKAAVEGKPFPPTVQAKLSPLLAMVMSAKPPGLEELCHATLPCMAGEHRLPLLRSLALNSTAPSLDIEQLQGVEELIRLEMYPDEADEAMVERLRVTVAVWRWQGRDAALLARILAACAKLKERKPVTIQPVLETAAMAIPTLRHSSLVDAFLVELFRELDLSHLLNRFDTLTWMPLLVKAHPQEDLLFKALELFDQILGDYQVSDEGVSQAGHWLLDCAECLPAAELLNHLLPHLLMFSVDADPTLRLRALCWLDDKNLDLEAHLPLLLEQWGLMLRCPALYPRAPLALAAFLERSPPLEILMPHLEQLTGLLSTGMEQFQQRPDLVEWLLTACSALVRMIVRIPVTPISVSRYTVSREDEAPGQMQEELATRLIKLMVGQLSHEVRVVRLKAMSCLRAAGDCFAQPEERQRYWHLLHLQWRSLLPRLQESQADPAMQLACLQLMQSMCQVAGDFMQQRFTRELWPFLGRILEAGQPSAREAALALLATALGAFSLPRGLNEELGRLLVCTPWPSESLRQSANRVAEAWRHRDPDYAWWWLQVRADPNLKCFTAEGHLTIPLTPFKVKPAVNLFPL